MGIWKPVTMTCRQHCDVLDYVRLRANEHSTGHKLNWAPALEGHRCIDAIFLPVSVMPPSHPPIHQLPSPPPAHSARVPMSTLPGVSGIVVVHVQMRSFLKPVFLTSHSSIKCFSQKAP